MNKPARKIPYSLLLRWGIAIAGIWWIVSQITIRDHVRYVDATSLNVTQVPLITHAEEDAQSFQILDPHSGAATTVPRTSLVSGPDQKSVTLAGGGSAKVLGLRLLGDVNHNPSVEALLIREGSASPRFITPADVSNGYRFKTPQPLVEIGLATMLRRANIWLLVAAMAVFPLTFVFTSLRWHRLLRAVDVNLPFTRAFAINMVGSFYNNVMPGNTGGDFLKAFYAARQTLHKTRAVTSVFVDRIIGLLTLIFMGGTISLTQWALSSDKHSPTAVACLQVALACVALSFVAISGVCVLISARLRKATGLEFLSRKLPIGHHLEQVTQVMHMYQRRPVLVLWAFAITVPVHAATIVSAMLAGHAFGLPISPAYYFVVVPVAVLAASIPITPQGAGVMEGFIILLTSRQGATVSQAFALALCIRLVQVLWNLVGGIFVLRGGYSQPTNTSGGDALEAAQHDPQGQHAAPAS